MADQKHDESFKVVDRRLFTADGELRKEALEQERREQEAARAQPKPAASSTSGAKGAAASSSAQAPSSSAASAAPPPAAEAPAPSQGFQMLLDFLARNAALLLGGYADPRTGQAILDLEGARELIDMFDALREKTRGNLAPEDDQLLLDVLGNLKLSYLELSKAAAKAMQEKAKSQP